MRKKIKQMPVKYKRLDSGRVADFYFERSLDLIFSPGCFTVEIDHSGKEVGLPIDDCGEEHYFVGNLVVTDSGTAGHKQENRVTGQLLTISSRNGKETKVFTRTFADAAWSEWRSLAVTGMYDNISTPDQLLATVGSLVDESTRAKEVEESVKRSAVDISSLTCTADKENLTITANSMDGEVLHSVEIPAVTTEQAGVMSGLDKKVITKLSLSLSEEGNVTVGKFIDLNNIAVGEHLDVTEMVQGNYSYFKEECSPNDVFNVTTTGNNNQAAKNYAILDSNNIVIVIGDGNSLTNEVIVIPDGGAVFIVNSLKTDIKVNKVIDKVASVDSVKEIDNRFLKNIPFTKSNSYYHLYSAAVGNALTESIIGANGYSYAKIECFEGEEYIISTNGNTPGAKNYAILDKNNIVLALGNTEALVNEALTIPVGGKTLIVNSKTSGADIKHYIKIPEVNYNGEKLVVNGENVPFSEEKKTSLLYKSIKMFFLSLEGVSVGNNVVLKEDATAPTYSYIFLPVIKGDKFKINVPLGGTEKARICCVTDKAMKCTFLTTTPSFDGEVEIIEDGYIIINAHNIDSCDVDKLGEIKECKTNIPYNTQRDYYIPLASVAVGSQYGLVQPPIYVRGYCYAICRVYAGQQFSIKTTGNTVGAKGYAIFDNSMKCLAFATSAQTDRCITIWQDGYLVVNSKIEGFSLINIDTVSQKLNTEVFNKLKSEVVDARRYTVSDYNNSADFDEAYIGDTKTCALYLEYNRNIPTKGAVISRDIRGKTLKAEHTLEEAQAFIVPYLFYNQQKVGTIVLYDEATDNPFIFDKNGNKRFLSYE